MNSLLKIMSIRVVSIDHFLHEEYDIKNSLIKDAHTTIQKFITGTDEFNDNYSKEKVEFNVETRTEILKLHKDLTQSLTQRVIDINKAKSRVNFIIKLKRLLFRLMKSGFIGFVVVLIGFVVTTWGVIAKNTFISIIGLLVLFLGIVVLILSLKTTK